MNNKRVSVYSVGGAGLNIGSMIAERLNDSALDALGVVTPQLYYIDTSDSNLRKPGINRDHVFLYEGLDGSGKERSENHGVISKTTLKILREFEPGMFNLVICSAAGGSGAVIGHSLINELKKDGRQVVLILIGSTASRKEIENSIKTLKSLDGLARALEGPIAVHYVENARPHSREDIDRIAVNGALALLSLFGGTHDELDSADLRKWLTHEDLLPEAYSVTITYTHEQYAAAKDVISVATLAEHGTNTILDPVPAYQAVGYVQPSWVTDKNRMISKDEPLNFLLSSEIVQVASSALAARLTTVKSNHEARVRRDPLLGRGDSVGDNGIVL